MLFYELSQTNFNFSEYEDSTDFPISAKVNALMVDLTDIEKFFAMMDQTIDALKKCVDDKKIQIFTYISSHISSSMCHILKSTGQDLREGSLLR